MKNKLFAVATALALALCGCADDSNSVLEMAIRDSGNRNRTTYYYIHLEPGTNGTGEMEDQRIAERELGTATVAENAFSAASGYTFYQWNCYDSEGNYSGSLSAGGTITKALFGEGYEITLTAQWAYTGIPYTVRFAPNFEGYNASINGTVADKECKTGTSYYFGDIGSYTREGYAIVGWNTAADGTGTSYTYSFSNLTTEENAIVTLYAQWKYTYTVHFDPNFADYDETENGTIADMQCLPDKSYSLTSIDPYTREDYLFTGWNTKSDGSGTSYSTNSSFSNLATEEKPIVTLYAQWVLTGVLQNADGSYTINTYNIEATLAELADTGTAETVTLVADASVNNSGLSTIGSALKENSSISVALDLSKATSVTSIGYNAFSNCTGLTSVTIGNSVKSIGWDAFRGCNKLTGELVIPDSVTSIGSEAFRDCKNLTSVTIPDSVKSIGKSAFYDCTGLTSVDYTGTIAQWLGISFGADYYSNPLRHAHHLYIDGAEVTDLVIPDGVTSIGDYAFYGCTGLTSVSIPDSVASIGKSAFEDCTGLTSVTIGNSVTSIGEYAFQSCTGLTSVTIGNSVKSIGNHAFDLCTGLTGELVIPDSVTSIGNYAFNGCSGLTSVTIPDSVTSIESSAFNGCTGLTSVTIPNSVTSIGDYAFYYCNALTSVTFAATDNWYSYTDSDHTQDETAITVTDASANATALKNSSGALYNKYLLRKTE